MILFQERQEREEILSQIRFCLSLDESVPFSTKLGIEVDRKNGLGIPAYSIRIRLENDATQNSYALTGKFWHLVNTKTKICS